MKKHSVIISILATLVIVPLVGAVMPILDLIFPLAIAFRVPPDGPPFSEALLPLVAVISILIGGIGFLVFALTKQQRVGGLKAYCYFMFFYSALALCVWLVFFGSRFIRYFPISEFGFYIQWAIAIVPHLIWLSFLFIALKHLNQLVASNEQTDNKAIQPTR
ncbi:MAG: hypothetical protein ACYS7Y_03745 [Planctomycetota bacterium]|jgi:hypothetical protein